jgi:hypothetical protein
MLGAVAAVEVEMEDLVESEGVSGQGESSASCLDREREPELAESVVRSMALFDREVWNEADWRVDKRTG